MATNATDEIDKMTEIWVKLFHPRNPSRLLGPGCLKRLGKCEKGEPAVTSGLGDLAVKSWSGKVEGYAQRRCQLGVGLNFFENTRKYAQLRTDLTCCSCVSVFRNLLPDSRRLSSCMLLALLTHRATSPCSRMQSV